MKEENKKINTEPENYPRQTDSDKQFKQQDEFVQKQSNRTENDAPTQRDQQAERGGADTIGNP